MDLFLLSGLRVQRSFYGSEHGKGEADGVKGEAEGETGVLSQILRRAAGCGRSIRDARDMVSFMKDHHTINTDLKKRYFYLKSFVKEYWLLRSIYF